MSWKLTADLLVIAAYFAGVIGIGFYFSRKNRDTSDFALGGRSIPWWAVLASILAAEISAGTFFGAPGEGFRTRNFTYAQLMVGYLLARVIVSFVFIPAYYRHNVVSIYEFLETRFGPLTRRLASAVFLITRSLASGSRLWVPTILLVVIWDRMHPQNPLVGMNQFYFTGAVLVLIALLTAAYTAVGGIKAVIWTDVLQISVLFGALGFSLWYLLGHIPGGWEGAKTYLTGPHDLTLWSWTGELPQGAVWADYTLWQKITQVLTQEFTVWAAFLGSTFITLATHGTDQDMVQRMLTAKNKKQSAMATILSGIADIPVTAAVLAIGILLFVFYTHIIHDPNLPLNAKGLPDSSKAFPYFVVDVMPGGLRGLVIAGVLATTMGSLGTALNSLATSYSRDFHFRWFNTPADEHGRVRIIKIATVAFAGVLIAIGLLTAYVKAKHPELSIIGIILGSFGYTYGSLLGIFMVALFTKNRGSDIGNIFAMSAGFIVVAVLSNLFGLGDAVNHLLAGGHLPGAAGGGSVFQLPTIEFPWRIMVGSIVTAAVALCFTTPESSKPDGPPADAA